MSHAYLRAIPLSCITHEATRLEQGRTLKKHEKKGAKHAGGVFQALVRVSKEAAIRDGYLKGPSVIIILLNCGTYTKVLIVTLMIVHFSIPESIFGS